MPSSVFASPPSNSQKNHVRVGTVRSRALKIRTASVDLCPQSGTGPMRLAGRYHWINAARSERCIGRMHSGMIPQRWPVIRKALFLFLTRLFAANSYWTTLTLLHLKLVGFPHEIAEFLEAEGSRIEIWCQV